MTTGRARALRKNPTEAERRLWYLLRKLRQQGLHFRRQAPFGSYFADFACHRAKLVVEVDGSQHGDPEQAAYDAGRTRFLESRGYRVLRFWNADVMANTDRVVAFIFAEAAARLPPPLAPPRIGEGK